MNHDPGTEAQIILPHTRYDERRTHGLMWCWHKDNTCLLIASVDDVPVYLDCANIKAMIKLYINAATESHRKAGFISTKITDAEEGWYLRAVNADPLMSHAEQSVCKGLECWPIFVFVLDLDTTKKILYVVIHTTGSRRACEVVRPDMERIVKRSPDVFVEVPGYLHVETAQRIFLAENVVESRNVGVVSEVIKVER